MVEGGAPWNIPLEATVSGHHGLETCDVCHYNKLSAFPSSWGTVPGRRIATGSAFEGRYPESIVWGAHTAGG